MLPIMPNVRSTGIFIECHACMAFGFLQIFRISDPKDEFGRLMIFLVLHRDLPYEKKRQRRAIFVGTNAPKNAEGAAHRNIFLYATRELCFDSTLNMFRVSDP